jgi:hypothetical protein
MVNTQNGRGDPKPTHSNRKPPSLPTLAQAIALILESRDEQTELLWQLVANSSRGGHGSRNAPAPAPTTYGFFAATHPPLFTEAGEAFETDHWLRVIESKLGSYTARRSKRLSSSCSSCVATPAHGGLPGVMDRVLQCFPCPLHPSGRDEEEALGVHGPKVRWVIHTQLLKVVQPPGTVCTGPGGH